MSTASEKWSAEALGTALDPLVGGRVRAAVPTDAVAGMRPSVVIEPATEEEVSAALAFADREGLKVLTLKLPLKCWIPCPLTP